MRYADTGILWRRTASEAGPIPDPNPITMGTNRAVPPLCDLWCTKRTIAGRAARGAMTSKSLPLGIHSDTHGPSTEGLRKRTCRSGVVKT